MGDDDPAVRSAAQSRLEAAGEAAIPLLERAAASEDPEARDRARCSLARLRARRERGDVELTGLALLSFHMAGHTHQARGGHALAVRGGLRWLVGVQRPDGAFEPDHAVADAVAAAALISLELRTKSVLLTEAAAEAKARQGRAGVVDGLAFLWNRASLGAGWKPPEGPLRWRDDLEEACGELILACWTKKPPDPAVTARIEMSGGGPRETYLRWAARLNYWGSAPGSLRAAKVDLAGRQLDSDCGRGTWPAVGLRRRIESAAYGVLLLLQPDGRGGCKDR